MNSAQQIWLSRHTNPDNITLAFFISYLPPPLLRRCPASLAHIFCRSLRVFSSRSHIRTHTHEHTHTYTRMRTHTHIQLLNIHTHGLLGKLFHTSFRNGTSAVLIRTHVPCTITLPQVTSSGPLFSSSGLALRSSTQWKCDRLQTLA